MDVTILVQDCTLHGSLLNSLSLTLPAEQLTARELIQRYVHELVESHQLTPTPSRYRFFSPTADEALLNDQGQPPSRQIDVRRQCRLAFKAFESNGFVMLVDERQIDDLDEAFSITPISSIQFLRLVPLVGG